MSDSDELLAQLDAVYQARCEQSALAPDQLLDVPAGPGWRGWENFDRLTEEYQRVREAALNACSDPGQAARIIAQYHP